MHRCHERGDTAGSRCIACLHLEEAPCMSLLLMMLACRHRRQPRCPSVVEKETAVLCGGGGCSFLVLREDTGSAQHGQDVLGSLVAPLLLRRRCLLASVLLLLHRLLLHLILSRVHGLQEKHGSH